MTSIILCSGVALSLCLGLLRLCDIVGEAGMGLSAGPVQGPGLVQLGPLAVRGAEHGWVRHTIEWING